jgi:hypothetical protein
MSWDSSSYFCQKERENEKENSYLMGSSGSAEDYCLPYLEKETVYDEKYIEELLCIARTISETEPIQVSEFNAEPVPLKFFPRLTKMHEIAGVETYSYDDSDEPALIDRLKEDF